MWLDHQIIMPPIVKAPLTRTSDSVDKVHGTWPTIVIEFAKTDLMGTNTEIHFLPVSRDTQHLRLDGQVCFFRRPFPTL